MAGIYILYHSPFHYILDMFLLNSIELIFFWYKFFYILINKTVSLHLLWLIVFFFLLALFNFLPSPGLMTRFLFIYNKYCKHVENNRGQYKYNEPHVPSTQLYHICFKTILCVFVNVYFIPLLLTFSLEVINLITIYYSRSH